MKQTNFLRLSLIIGLIVPLVYFDQGHLMDAYGMLMSSPYSSMFTYNIQLNQSVFNVNLMSFFSIIGSPEFIFLAFLTIYELSFLRVENTIWIISGCFVYFANNLLKILYGEVRPYILDKQLKAFYCEKDFGMPSTHACMSVFFQISLLSVVDDLSIWNTEEIKEKKKKKIRTWIFAVLKIISKIFFLIIIFCVGVSRVYLGESSFLQVINGMIYGSIFVILYLDIVLPHVLPNVEAFWGMKQDRKIVWIPGYIQAIGSILLMHGLYFMSQMIKRRNVNVEAAERLFKRCQNYKGVNLVEFFQEKNMVNGAIISFVLPLIFVIMLSPGRFQISLFRMDYNKFALWMRFARILLILGAFIGFDFLFRWIEESIQSTFTVWFLEQIKMILLGTVVSVLFPRLFELIGISLQGDVFQGKKAVGIEEPKVGSEQ